MLTTESCKTCGCIYTYTPRWNIDTCPLCLIVSIENSIDWTCGECSLYISPLKQSEQFCVYRYINNNSEVYKMKNKAQAKKIIEKPCFTGTITSCLNYIKRHENKQK